MTAGSDVIDRLASSTQGSFAHTHTEWSCKYISRHSHCCWFLLLVRSCCFLRCLLRAGVDPVLVFREVFGYLKAQPSGFSVCFLVRLLLSLSKCLRRFTFTQTYSSRSRFRFEAVRDRVSFWLAHETSQVYLSFLKEQRRLKKFVLSKILFISSQHCHIELRTSSLKCS